MCGRRREHDGLAQLGTTWAMGASNVNGYLVEWGALRGSNKETRREPTWALEQAKSAWVAPHATMLAVWHLPSKHTPEHLVPLWAGGTSCSWGTG